MEEASKPPRDSRGEPRHIGCDLRALIARQASLILAFAGGDGSFLPLAPPLSCALPRLTFVCLADWRLFASGLLLTMPSPHISPYLPISPRISGSLLTLRAFSESALPS